LLLDGPEHDAQDALHGWHTPTELNVERGQVATHWPLKKKNPLIHVLQTVLLEHVAHVEGQL